jgi:hypothetical protein
MRATTGRHRSDLVAETGTDADVQMARRLPADPVLPLTTQIATSSRACS